MDLGLTKGGWTGARAAGTIRRQPVVDDEFLAPASRKEGHGQPVVVIPKVLASDDCVSAWDLVSTTLHRQAPTLYSRCDCTLGDFESGLCI